jgi:uncharacterized protein (DUF302 family)
MQLTVDRFSVISGRSFQSVLAAIESEIGHPDIRKFIGAIEAATTDDELQALVNDAVGPTNLMEFMRFDQGKVLRKESGQNGPQVIRLLVGNPLTMRKMVKFVPDAGSYAPVTILIDERNDGVHISYDTMTSLLACYESSEALQVAAELDDTVRTLILRAAN